MQAVNNLLNMINKYGVTFLQDQADENSTCLSQSSFQKGVKLTPLLN